MTATLMRNFKLHSTETALLGVHGDILRAADRDCAVVLLLLELSATFDTVDHGLLLHRLTTVLGLTSKAKFLLNWFKSYLTHRSQFVIINGSNSFQSNLLYGLPKHLDHRLQLAQNCAARLWS